MKAEKAGKGGATSLGFLLLREQEPDISDFKLCLNIRFIESYFMNSQILKRCKSELLHKQLAESLSCLRSSRLRIIVRLAPNTTAGVLHTV